MTRSIVALALLLVAGGCTTAARSERLALRSDCPPPAAVELQAPLPERPNRWWWGAAEPGRVALRSSFGLDGCPHALP